MDGIGNWEDALDGDVADELPSLEWDEMSAGPSLPGLEDTSLLDEEPAAADLTVTEWGALPWGPGSGEGYQPWAQMQTDSPPMGDVEVELDQPQYAAQNAHPDVDPNTIYDRDSYEPGFDERQTYGAGIFDLPDQGATFRQNDGMFSHNYALPSYIAREPEMDVFETEALDVNTGLPRVAQVNASGVQLMRSDPDRAWSPFAPPPYGTSSPQNTQPYVNPTLHNYGNAIPAFGAEGARALLNLAAQRCPNDPNQRGYYICQMIDEMIPQMSPRALMAVAKLQESGYPGNPVELVVGHVLMKVCVCDLSDKIKAGDRSGRMPRLDKLQRQGAFTPELAQCARRHLGPLVNDPRKASAAIKEFHGSKAGRTTAGMLGDVPEGDAETAPAATSGAPNWLVYGLGALVVGGAAYFGYDWWQKQQKKKRKSARS